MKKLKLVGILAAVVLIGGSLSIPLINNHIAYKVEKALCEIPLPEETELIESLSQAGKLTGNGNGMQYFGAILIRSELSLEELDAYYSDYRSKKKVDGSWNISEAEMLDIFAYNVSTKDVVSSGKTSWSATGNEKYYEVTGEK